MNISVCDYRTVVRGENIRREEQHLDRESFEDEWVYSERLAARPRKEREPDVP